MLIRHDSHVVITLVPIDEVTAEEAWLVVTFVADEFVVELEARLYELRIKSVQWSNHLVQDCDTVSVRRVYLHINLSNVFQPVGLQWPAKDDHALFLFTHLICISELFNY